MQYVTSDEREEGEGVKLHLRRAESAVTYQR
jgi:hypothetical protein